MVTIWPYDNMILLSCFFLLIFWDGSFQLKGKSLPMSLCKSPRPELFIRMDLFYQTLKLAATNKFILFEILIQKGPIALCHTVGDANRLHQQLGPITVETPSRLSKSETAQMRSCANSGLDPKRRNLEFQG